MTESPAHTKTRGKHRLLYIVSSPMTLRYLLRGQLRYMNGLGYEVYAASSPGADLEAVSERDPVVAVAVPMAREISPLSDLVALVRLIRLLRRIQPEIVNAGTPKAGLLGMLAAFLSRVPVRVYLLRGLRLEGASGWRRRILILSEKLAAYCAQAVICVSDSLRARCLDLRLAPPEKTFVLGNGSSNGVDLQRFRPRRPDDPEVLRLRRQMGISEGQPVIGFVGRLTRDKGVAELLAVFEALGADNSDLRLLLVGDFEEGDPVSESVHRRLRRHPNVVITGFVPDTSAYYALIDVIVFPSFREGLPNVPLEAAASGRPVVAFRATGTVDVVVDGRSGFLVPLGDTAALAEGARRYLKDPKLRVLHGSAARQLARTRFDCEVVWKNLAREYRRLRQAASPQ